MECYMDTQQNSWASSQDLDMICRHMNMTTESAVFSYGMFYIPDTCEIYWKEVFFN